MFRNIQLIPLGFAFLMAMGGGAEAQFYYPGGYGYAGYGFGGWGSTPQGSILRGLGAYAEGAGVYNYDTAVADSIEADTAIRLNQYIWNSELEARRRYARLQATRLNMNDAQYRSVSTGSGITPRPRTSIRGPRSTRSSTS
jgi:hypothetical protein